MNMKNLHFYILIILISCCLLYIYLYSLQMKVLDLIYFVPCCIE